MNVMLRRIGKKALSVVCALAVVLSVLSVQLWSVAGEEIYYIEDNAPAIPMTVLTKTDLGKIAVKFDDTYRYGDDVQWSTASSGLKIDDSGYLSVFSVGIFPVTAEYNGQTKTIYVVSKSASASEWVLYEETFNDGKVPDNWNVQIYNGNPKSWKDVDKEITYTDSSVASVKGVIPFYHTTQGANVWTTNGVMYLKNDVLNAFGDYTVNVSMAAYCHNYGGSGILGRISDNGTKLDETSTFAGFYNDGGSAGKSQAIPYSINYSNNSWANTKISDSTAWAYGYHTASLQDYSVKFDGTKGTYWTNELTSGDGSKDSPFTANITDGKGAVGIATVIIYDGGLSSFTKVHSIKVTLNDDTKSPETTALDNYKIAAAKPAIPMNVLYSANMGDVLIEFNGEYVLGSDVTFTTTDTSGSIVIDNAAHTITALGTGTYEINAQCGEKSTKLYAIVKNADATEWVLYEKAFSENTIPEDWVAQWRQDGPYGTISQYGWVDVTEATAYKGTQHGPDTTAPGVVPFGNTSSWNSAGYFTLKNDIVSAFSDYTVSTDLVVYNNWADNQAAFFVYGRTNLSAENKLSNNSVMTGIGYNARGNKVVSFSSAPNSATESSIAYTVLGENYTATSANSNTNSISTTVKFDGAKMYFKESSNADTIEAAATSTNNGTVGIRIGMIGDSNIANFINVRNIKIALNADTKEVPSTPDTAYCVKTENPALPMIAATKISTNDFRVQINGIYYTGSGLEWSTTEGEDKVVLDNTAKTILVKQKGSFKVTVKNSKNETANVYIVARSDKEGSEYVLYEDLYKSTLKNVDNFNTTVVKSDNATEAYFTENFANKIGTKGFVPFAYNQNENADLVGTWSSNAYTLLNNEVVSAMSDYKITADIKMYCGNYGSVGLIGRVAGAADNKFTIASSTAYGFAIAGGNAAKGLNTVVANARTKVADTDTTWGSDFEAKAFTLQTLSLEFAGDTATFKNETTGRSQQMQVPVRNGAVGFYAGCVNDTTEMCATVNAQNIKVVLTGVDETKIPQGVKEGTEPDYPNPAVYVDNGNYKFTVKNGSVEGYEKIDPSQPYSERVVIPSEYEGQAITAIGINLFKVTKNVTANKDTEPELFAEQTEAVKAQKEKCASLAELVISDGVVSIGDSAFASASNLEYVTLPSTLTKIVDWAFYGTPVANINFPDALSSIGFGAFGQCKGLKTVTFGSSITTIGESSFSGCSGLTEVTLPFSLKTLSKNAFNNCTSLTKVVVYNRELNINEGSIPANATIYGGSQSTAKTYADENNINFVSIDEEIDRLLEEFRKEEEKKNAELDAKANAIDTGVVYKIGYADGTKKYFIAGMTAGDDDNRRGYVFPTTYDYVNSSGAVTPNVNVTYVTSNAFKGKPEILKFYGLTIPEGYTQIGDSAFIGAINLRKLVLPDTLTTIDNWAFNGATSLKELSIPKSLSKIGGSSFGGSTALAKINIPDDSVLSEIGASAFSGCASLDGSLTFPITTSKFGKKAFAGTALKNVYITNKTAEIGEEAFPKTTIIHGVPGSTAEKFANDNGYQFVGDVEDILEKLMTTVDTTASFVIRKNNGKYVISGFSTTNGGKVVLPAVTDYTDPKTGEVTKNVYISEVDSNAFKNSSSRSKIFALEIPEGVTKVGNSAFNGCSNLARLTLPNSITFIDEWSFSYCNITGDVKIGTDCATIKSYAFTKNDKMTGVYIYNKDCTIEKDAFPKGIVIYGINGSTAEEYCKRYSKDYTFVEVQPLPVETINDIPDNGNYKFGLNKDKTEIETYSRKNDAIDYSPKVVIPSTVDGVPVKIIGNNLFKDKAYAPTLQALIISEGIETVGDSAFANCARLKYVSLPKGLKKLDNFAFIGTGIKSIEIPDTVTSIGDGTFQDCSSLKSIRISNPKTKISTSAFNKVSPDCVIYGLTNSTAETAARKSKLKFVSIGVYDRPADDEDIDNPDADEINNDKNKDIKTNGGDGDNNDGNVDGIDSATDLKLVIIIVAAVLAVMLLGCGATIAIVIVKSGDGDYDGEDGDDDEEYDDDDEYDDEEYEDEEDEE